VLWSDLKTIPSPNGKFLTRNFQFQTATFQSSQNMSVRCIRVSRANAVDGYPSHFLCT